MQATTIIYSLFGLVLGLGIAGILTGFADAWRVQAGVGRVHAEIRIGWLVPLLGLLVIMDQTQFYIAAWEMRDAIPFSYFSLLCVLGVIGTYFLCSTFVFPDNPDEWPDFDDYYMRVRRIVGGGMLIANLSLFGFAIALMLTGRTLDLPSQATAFELVLGLLFLPLLVLLVVVRSKRASLIVLALLVFDILADAAAPIVRAAL